MKKSTKKLLVAAGCMILTGAVMMGASLLRVEFRIQEMSTVQYKTVSHDVGEHFTRIEVQDTDCEVEIVHSTDSEVKVECSDTENIYHTVNVEGDTLKISRVDSRKWYEHIVVFDLGEEQKVTVYIPKGLKSIYLETGSGDIMVEEMFHFDSAHVSTASGEISFFANADELTAETESGSIEIAGIISDDMKVSSSSGAVNLSKVKTDAALINVTDGGATLTEVTADTLRINTKSGGVKLSDVLAKEKMNIETTSSSVKLEDSDGGEIHIEAASGNVTGNLLTAKCFVTSTTSGTVRITNNMPDAGRCEVITTSGDIRLEAPLDKEE